ncbi:tyrosine-type recombinase/integrase [Latilactobacillus sakei]|uniref:tyrosine-type recombinase/integrase n=1 Tax=Latilactobacillus sakei TaxID=1599 RepID=UPI001CFC1126|nr:site-specific integrase [Latilactobacillus sakei]MCB4409175.1 site-specific integrase [Latilactobacillus sakei]
MTSKLQETTKYAGVFKDLKSGMYFYQTELGIDRITGRRVRKKARKDLTGRPFKTAMAANRELTRVKREYYQVNSYANYQMTYREYMEQIYIPAYKTEVEESTFAVRQGAFVQFCDRFGSKQLRDINIEDVQNFRTFLLTDTDEGGAGYSQSYASLVFGMFRKTLDKAVSLQYLDFNVSKRIKAIPKSKAIVPYWTANEFKAVIKQIYTGDFLENLYFVMLWVYFMTGVRVNEGMALWWSDIDLDNKHLRVHHMLYLKSRTDWTRKDYTKTADGKRTIALDDTTVDVLRKWRERQKQAGLGHDDDFVFTYDGLPMIKSTLARVIQRYATAAGVKPIQGKGLRHSHASYLINEFNVSVLVLSKRLGHSGPDVTLKNYSHMWVGADTAIVEQMEGHIKVDTADQSSVKFNGNQAIKNLSELGAPPSTPPKSRKGDLNVDM